MFEPSDILISGICLKEWFQVEYADESPTKCTFVSLQVFSLQTDENEMKNPCEFNT